MACNAAKYIPDIVEKKQNYIFRESDGDRTSFNI